MSFNKTVKITFLFENAQSGQTCMYHHSSFLCQDQTLLFLTPIVSAKGLNMQIWEEGVFPIVTIEVKVWWLINGSLLTLSEMFLTAAHNMNLRTQTRGKLLKNCHLL